MGAVWLAKDQDLNRDVALKQLRADLTPHPGQPLLNIEGGFLAKLNHPKIVQIYDLVKQNDNYLLVMEYVSGNSLQILLREETPTYSERLLWLTDITEALTAAHKQGIVHCDLKSENVLIDGDRHAKVSDFGIAKQDVDPRKDIVAIGTLAAELLGEEIVTSPGVHQLIAELVNTRASKTINAEYAHQGFRRAWHISCQNETTIEQPSQPKSIRLKAAALATLVLLALGAWALLPKPIATRYIAIAPAKIHSPESHLTAQQISSLDATLQFALSEAITGSSLLAMAGTVDFTATSTSAYTTQYPQHLAALGADEVVSSSINCQLLLCEINLERRDSKTLRLLAQDNFTLLLDNPLDNYQMVLDRWQRLYPKVKTSAFTTNSISEEHFLSFIALRQQLSFGGLDQSAILESAKALLTTSPDFLPLYVLLGDASREVFYATNNVQVLEHLEQIIAVTTVRLGDSLPLATIRFKSATQRKDFEQAARELATLATLGLDSSALSALKGDLYFETGQFQPAQAQYVKSLNKRSSMELLFNHALNYYYWDKPEQALATLEQLLTLYGNSPKALGMAGSIVLQQGDIEAAIQYYESAMALNQHAVSATNIGVAYMLAGNYTQAEIYFEQSYAASPSDPTTLLILADIKKLLGKNEAARRFYRAVIDQYSTSSVGIDQGVAAQAYAHLGNFDEALSLISVSNTSNMEDPQSASDQALVLSLAQQHLAAIAAIEHAIAQGVSAVWFTFSWYNDLCHNPKYRALMSQHWRPDYCTNVSLDVQF
jgi:serine/threonine-protein kinase